MLLLSLFLISLGINAIFFTLALWLQTDLFTDITYSLSFIALSLVLTIRFGISHHPVFIAEILVLIWALRLGSYLFTRILRMKVDHRFDDKRHSAIRFGSFWLIQAVTVFIVMLPLTSANMAQFRGASRAIPVSASFIFEIPGLVLAALGIIIEGLADIQKFRFKIREENANQPMMTGLWSKSRHPNYFGELLFWWGIYFAVLPYQSFIGLFSVIGPLFITILLLKVSGIPILERQWMKKWGDDPKFMEYFRKTPVLIPLFKRRK